MATWTVVVTGWPTTGLAVVEVINVVDADFCAWGVTVAGALGPAVVVQEGGYDLAALGSLAVAALSGVAEGGG